MVGGDDWWVGFLVSFLSFFFFWGIALCWAPFVYLLYSLGCLLGCFLFGSNTICALEKKLIRKRIIRLLDEIMVFDSLFLFLVWEINDGKCVCVCGCLMFFCFLYIKRN